MFGRRKTEAFEYKQYQIQQELERISKAHLECPILENAEKDLIGCELKYAMIKVRNTKKIEDIELIYDESIEHIKQFVSKPALLWMKLN